MSSENDSVSPPLNIEKCNLVLVDVAGTTTSINFVKDTLFPFVHQQVEAFLKSKWDEESVKECITQLKEKDVDLDLAAAVELVKTLTAEESSNKGLKTLQGLIYEEGYTKGELKAHVFDDVPEAFESWASVRQVAVYSTGSVESQKLLFTHTTSGDISAHISKYFDQTVGLKTEAESYKKIAEETKVAVEEIVFVTDDVNEATAAKSGGVHAVLISREGNPAFPDEISKDFTVISSFKDLVFDKTSKRKIEEELTAPEAPPSKIPKTDTEKEKPETSEKVENEESMEVDAEVEKPAETASTSEEPKTATEETENLVNNAPEKTDTDTKTNGEVNADTEMVAAETNDKVGAEPVTSSEPVEEAQTTETAAEDKTQTEKVEEPVVEDKTEEKATEPEPEVEEAEAVEERTVEETVKDPTKAGEEAKEVEEAVEEVKEAEPEPEESQPVSEKVEETKTEEKVEVEEQKTEEKPIENGDENAETSTAKIEEKENKSVLANGVENGSKDESEVDNSTVEKESETTEGKNDDNVDNKDDDNEVKVKKLEESAESKTVSVEV